MVGLSSLEKVCTWRSNEEFVTVSMGSIVLRAFGKRERERERVGQRDKHEKMVNYTTLS